MSRMNCILLCSLLLLAAPLPAFSSRPSPAGSSITASKWKAPWFCHGLECPSFAVEDQTDDFELRKYAPGTWASTKITDMSYDKALNVGFWRLFKYISGKNDLGQKIEMTAPVKVKLIPSQGPFCENTFIMSFYVSDEFQGNPPKPSSEDVFIEQQEEVEYFVAGYGGFTSEKEVVTRARSLLDKLESAGYSFEAKHFFSAGYDSPFRLIGRHNEIWVERKGEN